MDRITHLNVNAERKKLRVAKQKNPRIGSDFDVFLEQEGFFEEATAVAMKRVGDAQPIRSGARMDIESIKTPADYKAALKIVESLMDAPADSPEGDRLDALVTLIESYEREHFPMGSLLG